jgi:hypothetical protein
MSTKKFKNLGQGSEKIKQNLSSFITIDSSKSNSYNPLIDKKKPKEKLPEEKEIETIEKEIKPEETPKKEKSLNIILEEDVKTPEVIEKVKEPIIVKPEKIEGVGETIEKNKPKEKSDLAPEVELVNEAPKQKKIKEKNPQELPTDFTSHSCIFSAGQLNKLRDKVFLKKASGDRKYSIKDALYEAFNLLLEERKQVSSYPNDFVTYSPLISNKQFEKLYSFVYNIKAKKDSKYAMKYAIYEAIEMYLAK